MTYEWCGWLFVFDQTTTHTGYPYMSSTFDNLATMDELMSLPGKLLMTVVKKGKISELIVIKMLYSYIVCAEGQSLFIDARRHILTY